VNESMNLPMEERDYFVRVLPFGVPIPAFIRLNPDGITYTLYLNADYDFSHWLDGYEHELWHMIHDDMFKDCDITEIEPNLKRGA